MFARAKPDAGWPAWVRLYNRLRCACLAAIALLAASTWPAPARAQQPISLASLQISIWPEFDRPTSLVILDGVVAPGVSLPAQLSVRMPAAAVSPNAVATTGSDGSLLQAAYTTAADGGDIIIKFTATSAAFRVEYYDPGLSITGEARSFAFRWKSDLAIAQATLRVQVPAGASNLTGQPSLTAAGVGEFGLDYDMLNIGAVAAGATVAQDIRYTKSGSGLSATAVGPQLAAGAATPPATANAVPGWLPLGLGAATLGLVIAGGGGLWYSRRRSARRPGGAHRSARRARAEPSRVVQPNAQPRASRPEVLATEMGASKGRSAPTVKDGSTRFCTQCGRRQEPEDRFCRQCGAPVRA